MDVVPGKSPVIPAVANAIIAAGKTCSCHEGVPSYENAFSRAAGSKVTVPSGLNTNGSPPYWA
jgi:hypothetical protein